MTESPVNNPMKVFLAAIVNVALFSCMNLFVKLAAETHSVPQIMFFRSALALIPVVMLIVWYRKDFSLFKTKRLGGHLTRSLIGTVSMSCIFTSFSMLPLANATAIQFASPLILTALSVPLLKETVGPHRWAAVIVGLCSVVFMLRPGGEGSLFGSMVAVAAAFLSALAMIAVRRLGSTEHSLTIVFYFSLFSALFAGIAMIFAWTPPTMVSLMYLLAIGLLGGLGQVFLTYAYANAPAAYVSPFSYLTILFSVGFDLLIWGHVPGQEIVTGSVIVVLSGLYIVFREARKQYKAVIRTNLYGLQPAQPTEKDKAPDSKT